MSRPLRIEYPGAWYHVMNRGRRSESIFSDKQGSGRSLVYKLTGRLNYGVALTLWAKTDTFREETDECSETACRSKDGGM